MPEWSEIMSWAKAAAYPAGGTTLAGLAVYLVRLWLEHRQKTRAGDQATDLRHLELLTTSERTWREEALKERAQVWTELAQARKDHQACEERFDLIQAQLIKTQNKLFRFIVLYAPHMLDDEDKAALKKDPSNGH